MIAWQAVDASAYADRISGGVGWALEQQPWTRPRDPKFGHDTALAGWSWAPATHSWLEPTAFFVVALRAAGLADNARRLEGVRLLVDRLLPSGGANYGNTVVLDQELLEHTHSSGVVAWALSAEDVRDERLKKTIQRLKLVADRPTGAASLAWAARGLAAHQQTDAATAVQVAATLTTAVMKQKGLHKVSRRTALAAGGLIAAGLLSLAWKRSKTPVFVAKSQRYDGQLAQTIRDGLTAVGINGPQLAGKRVLLKPNLVEPSRERPQMTTHPAMIIAAAEVFRGWGAEVVVGEGPGHVRDTEAALIESGVGEALD
ncbi:unnamed protein product, partial [Symbiodinium sp. CCMP2456]